MQIGTSGKPPSKALAWLNPPAPPEVDKSEPDAHETSRHFGLKTENAEYAIPGHGRVFRIGSDPDACQVTLEDKRVSRTHAWGYYNNGTLYVRDAHSTRGTKVDGKEVSEDKWASVHLGSTLELGGQSLKLDLLPPKTRKPFPVPVQSVATGGPGGPAVALSFLEMEAGLDKYRPRPIMLAAMNRATTAMARQPGCVELPRGVPTLLITDLHARRDYLVQALESKTPEGERVYDLLKAGRINVVCMGDGMHNERAAERWAASDQEASESLAEGKGPGPEALALMDQEMNQSLGVMKIVMDLKNSFPDHFYFLRGNHEDIKGHFFFRYAKSLGANELVRDWMSDRLGPDFVDKYAEFENSMPLAAVGQGFAVSHSPPGEVVSREDVDQRSDNARQSLNWTDNAKRDDAGHYVFETDEHKDVLKQTLANLGVPDGIWFSGHKPVKLDEHNGLYRTQFDGHVVQFNNPDRHVVALVPADGKFNPEEGMHWLDVAPPPVDATSNAPAPVAPPSTPVA